MHTQERRQPPRLLRAHDSAITAFDVAPNGQLAATGQAGINANVAIWNLQTMQPLYSFQVQCLESHNLPTYAHDHVYTV